MFQYISCCYLSRSSLFLSPSLSCFNTSHVVIYRIAVMTATNSVFMFQYISCCYLSICRAIRVGSLCVSIHLMLLFIFCPSASRMCSIQVSIHLMLLFIIYQILPAILELWFQYISCCYLSYSQIIYRRFYLRFNTSHVVIYLKPLVYFDFQK